MREENESAAYWWDRASKLLHAAKLEERKAREALYRELHEINGGVVYEAGYKLTRRECEVFSLILEDLTNKEIADQLGTSERTVKYHMTSILLKAGVRKRTELREEMFNAEKNNSGDAIPVLVRTPVASAGH